jgi:hypothetical protein
MVDKVQLYVSFPFTQTSCLRPADVLAAGLDSGLAISIILIFFCLQYPANGTIGATNVAKWWGNNVFLKTADGKGMSYYTINGTFGPSTWG